MKEAGLFDFPKKSFKRKLVFSFLICSIVPVIIFSIFATISTQEIINSSSKKLLHNNLEQTQRGIDQEIKYFENILNRIYTDDDLVANVKNLNKGIDEELQVNQLHRFFRGHMSAQDDIVSIMVITNSGKTAFYDALTGSFNTSSWYEEHSEYDEYLLDKTAGEFETNILPTRFVGTYSGSDQYIYHMAHRVFDYKNVNEQIGIIVMSIKEQSIVDVYSSGDQAKTKSVQVIIDENNNVMSSNHIEFLENDLKYSEESWSSIILNEVNSRKILNTSHLIADHITLPNQKWSLISVIDISETENELLKQNTLIIFATLLLIVILSMFILMLVRKLSLSIVGIVETIKMNRKGNLQARIIEKPDELQEVKIISSEFNLLMDRIDLLINEIHDAAKKQKDMETSLLESQINPHFLYNTLDSINWISIENEQFVISQMITSLARILRYGITNINEKVTISDEVDWMVNYLGFQKIRYKDQFDYTIVQTDNIDSYPIYKLLFQPFIENSIIHGLKGLDRRMMITINLIRYEETLIVTIHDDGVGMDQEMLDELSSTINQPFGGTHIGVKNSVNRMRSYYGMDKTDVEFVSHEEEGTLIILIVRGFFND